jgi:predicted Zn-dependent protease
LPRRAQAAFFIVLGLVAILGVGAWLVLKRQPGVSPDAIAAALTLPGEPPFPAACVSARGRTEVLAAATGKAAWSTVPAGTLERAFAEARAPGVANEAARANLEKVVAACPNSAVARTLLGKTLVRLDQDQAAVTQLRAATALAPGYVNARFDLAVALVKQSEPAQALPLVTSVLVDQPEHPGARFLRGQLRLAAGDKQGAVDDLAAYTAAEPQAGSGWASLGEALAQVGDKARSRSAFCRALELGIERVRDRCPGR